VPLRSRPYKRVSLRETCRQLVEQAGDSAARRHRNHAENVLRVEFGSWPPWPSRSSRISPFVQAGLPQCGPHGLTWCRSKSENR